jgi:predicted DNA-binding transcriptional regulator AlpA
MTLNIPPATIIAVLKTALPDGYIIVAEEEFRRVTGDDLLCQDEVAAELGIQVSTLARWRSTGEGPSFVKVPGFRTPRYRKRDLEAWKADLKCYKSAVEYRHAS